MEAAVIVQFLSDRGLQFMSNVERRAWFRQIAMGKTHSAAFIIGGLMLFSSPLHLCAQPVSRCTIVSQKTHALGHERRLGNVRVMSDLPESGHSLNLNICVGNDHGRHQRKRYS